MSYYNNNMTVDGLKCSAFRGGLGGDYCVIFEREFATIEQIEAIDWSKPVLGGKGVLPDGYGFDLLNITYKANSKSYEVTVRTKRQYWGDVTGYQERIDELKEQLAEKDTQISGLNAAAASQQEELRAKEETIQALEETVTRQKASLQKAGIADVGISEPAVEGAETAKAASEQAEVIIGEAAAETL